MSDTGLRTHLSIPDTGGLTAGGPQTFCSVVFQREARGPSVRHQDWMAVTCFECMVAFAAFVERRAMELGNPPIDD